MGSLAAARSLQLPSDTEENRQSSTTEGGCGKIGNTIAALANGPALTGRHGSGLC
jgi:hypothetical protein